MKSVQGPRPPPDGIGFGVNTSLFITLSRTATEPKSKVFPSPSPRVVSRRKRQTSPHAGSTAQPFALDIVQRCNARRFGRVRFVRRLRTNARVAWRTEEGLEPRPAEG